MIDEISSLILHYLKLVCGVYCDGECALCGFFVSTRINYHVAISRSIVVHEHSCSHSHDKNETRHVDACRAQLDLGQIHSSTHIIKATVLILIDILIDALKRRSKRYRQLAKA